MYQVPLRFSVGAEKERAAVGRNSRTCLEKPTSQARTGAGEIHYP